MFRFGSKRLFSSLVSRKGERVPDVVFRARAGGDWLDLSTKDLFSGKRVVLFALPGAFTPTCSSTHLPRYSELASTIKAQNIDDIYCLSVNDGFVMESWGKSLQSKGVTLLPDGNGEFTNAMGMLVDKTDLGFGGRSWRYSMIVDDGVIEEMFIESQVPGDPFAVSDGDSMLSYLNPEALPPLPALIFTRKGCPSCDNVRELLNGKGQEFQEVSIGEGEGVSLAGVNAVSGSHTVPQVFIGGKRIGGLEDVQSYYKE